MIRLSFVVKLLVSLLLPFPLSKRVELLIDRWSQPRDLYLTIVICSLAAAVQYASSSQRNFFPCQRYLQQHPFFLDRGWDQTGSNGANLIFPQVLGIPTADGAPNASVNQWIVGIINSG